jgi:hypothetical protein
VEAGASPALYRNCKSALLTSQDACLSPNVQTLLGIRRRSRLDSFRQTHFPDPRGRDFVFFGITGALPLQNILSSSSPRYIFNFWRKFHGSNAKRTKNAKKNLKKLRALSELSGSRLKVSGN